jgi:hypothetical protein
MTKPDGIQGTIRIRKSNRQTFALNEWWLIDIQIFLILPT